MLRSAWSQIRTHPTRILTVCLAVVLGIGFTAAVVVFNGTYSRSIADSVAAPYRHADVVAEIAYQSDWTPADEAALRAVPGVSQVTPTYSVGVKFVSTKARGYLSLDTVSESESLRWFGLSAGKWPAPDQLLIDDSTAATTNLAVGDQVTLFPFGEAKGRTVTVSGIAANGSSALAGADYQAYGPPALQAALGAETPRVVMLSTTPGTSAESVVAAVDAALAGKAKGYTADAYAALQVTRMTGGADVLGYLLIGFAVIALVAATIVIANTFTVLLAQRRAQVALLRCVGSTRSQVARMVLAEAAMVGAIGSLVGVGVGIGVGAGAAALTGLLTAGLAVPVTGLIAVFAVGVVLTMVAAVFPSRRAMRVSPLAALRPVDDPDTVRRSGIGRNLLAGGLVLVGGAGMAFGAVSGSFLAAVAGGALAAFGILLATRTFLPPLMRIAGRLVGRGGPTARLAAANSVRNPGRTATTCAALMFGVGLIVTLQVGASSAQATLDADLAARYPVDLSVTADGARLPAGSLDRVRSVPELSGVAEISGAEGKIAAGGAELPVILAGVTDAAKPVLHGGADDLSAGSDAAPALLVPPFLVAEGFEPGTRATVTVDGKSLPVTVTPSRAADVLGGTPMVLVSAQVLSRIAPQAAPVAIWAALQPGADPVTAMSSLNREVASLNALEISGAITERESVARTLGTVVTVATAMLAVAVVISLVGIAGTLGLSVIERTRESGLLRALGLQRRQLRGMLAIEAALMAVLGTLVGVAAGLLFGWVGAAATIGQAGQSATLTVPWLQLLLVVLLAAAAGVLASVLPARRAAKVEPTVALAELG